MVLEVTDVGVATSGRYERGDHIIDPRTGRAATGLMSVTVVADDLALADGYATAALVLGKDGPTWLAQRGAGIRRHLRRRLSDRHRSAAALPRKLRSGGSAGCVTTQDPPTEGGLVDFVCPVVDPGRPLVAIPVRQDGVVGDTEGTVHLNRRVDRVQHRSRD